MAIVTRTHKGSLDTAEHQAVIKFFQNPALDPQHQEHNANVLEDFMYRWNVVVNQESLEVAFQKLAEAGVLKLRTEAAQKYESAVQGYTEEQKSLLNNWLRSRHLIATPGTDEMFENSTAFSGAMRGRQFTTANLDWCLTYLQGKGTRLHWEERPRQNPPQSRGHVARSSEDYRFAPKEDTNLHPLSRFSHSSNPKFNGEDDRKRMQRPGAVEEDVMASTNRVWMMQAKALIGRSHSETLRIQRIVDSTPGGGYAAYQAGLREQRMIENERARGR